MTIQANKWLIGSVGAALLAGAALWEGTKQKAYYDVVGVPTVCMGHTGKDVQFGRVYSLKECNDILRRDLIAHTKPMLDCITVPLNENQYTAFALFTLNVGPTAFCKSSLLKKLNSGDYTGACNGLMQWVYADGKKFQGLINRRAYERSICLGSTLPTDH